jgi:hypothetical protein
MTRHLILRCCLLAIIPAILPGCAHSPTRLEASMPTVETLGANANFAKGDFSSYANLADFRHRSHVYAVGPVQHLGGEITVIDSVPYAVEIVEGKLKVTSTWEYQPPFLVYSEVAKWRKIAIPGSVRSYAEFEKWLGAAAAQQGIGEDRPFAFRIRARPTTLTVTVMNRPASAIPGDKPTRAYQTTWNIGGQDTDFVGFYSTQHAGVFLGAGEKVHIHALTHDRTVAGHVQDFTLPPGSELFLPR